MTHKTPKKQRIWMEHAFSKAGTDSADITAIPEVSGVDAPVTPACLIPVTGAGVVVHAVPEVKKLRTKAYWMR
ncbi:MAG: hypothetical protein WCJ01_09360 [Ignavibacteria bacterium]